MTLQKSTRHLEWPVVVPVTAAELDQLRETCERIMANGGETGEIARDMLAASNGLTNLIDKIDAFLDRDDQQ